MSSVPVRADDLVALARSTRDRAYAPYSGFRVGAAVQSETGALYAGCNIENATYGATLCAERAAIAAMVAAGESRLVALAVYTEADELTMPCGICRQVLREFADDATVIVAGPNAQRKTTLARLLPEPFTFRKPR